MYSFRLAPFILFLLTAGCTDLFFYPTAEHVLSPDVAGVQFEDVYLEDFPKLHGWYMPAENPKAQLLFLHGNARNISNHFPSVYWLPAEGISVFALDYRGYGKSEGSPSPAGLVQDVARAIRYLADKNPELPTLLFGQSLGAAIGLAAAADPNNNHLLHGVIADSTFSSYRDVVQDKLADLWLTYPLQYPFSRFVDDSFAPKNFVEKVTPVPLLLAHGLSDETVLPYHSEVLFERAGHPKQLLLVPGARHIQTFSSEKNRAQFIQFVDEIVANFEASSSKTDALKPSS